MTVYKQADKYAILRKNAFQAVIDTSEVSRAYVQEFYRMYCKNFIDYQIVENYSKEIDTSFDIEKFAPQNIMQKNEVFPLDNSSKNKQIYERVLLASLKSKTKNVLIRFKPKKIMPLIVQVVGSFSGWKDKLPLKYDQFAREYRTTLTLLPGEY